MTFKDLVKTVTEDMHITLTNREEHLLRTAFHVMLKPKAKTATLRFDICFADEKRRDDWDLTCSCGALFHCEDANEVDWFIKENHYCSVCGRKFKLKK